jgi:large subunit ribosomal protein L24
LFANVSLAGNRLTFDNFDCVAAGSRLRGHLALTLDEPRDVDGEIGLDALDVAPLFALAIGSAGRGAAEPLSAGLLKGWRGRIAFQALRGVLPGGSELRPLGGSLKSDGQSLAFDAVKGSIGGGEVSAGMEVTPDANGLALNARLALAGVDGAALRYRSLKMPAGRVSMQATLSSQGRSFAALTGALSGSGTVTLESVSIAGLDPKAFEAAIRASDSGQASDDTKLRQIVETALSAGNLPVASAQIPFNIRDGRLRIDASALEAPNARAIVSGGYDISADQADIRANLTSTAIGSGSSRPEIQLFAMGTPDALARSVDVASLSAWLAVRAIDRETRRLDAIERGEPPPVEPPIIPPATAALPSAATPEATPTEVPPPGRDPRRLQPRAKAAPPRLPGVPPATTPPVTGQQLAPLPPPIEVRPPPGPAPLPAKPKPRQPLALTPPRSANP